MNGFDVCVYNNRVVTAALGGHVSAAVWLGLLASVSAAAFLVWARDDENADDVDDDEDDDDEDEDDGGGGNGGDRDQQQQRKTTIRRRIQQQRRKRRRTLLSTRTSRRRWTTAVRTTLVVTAILRLILSVGPEPTLWLLGAITVRASLPPLRLDPLIYLHVNKYCDMCIFFILMFFFLCQRQKKNKIYLNSVIQKGTPGFGMSTNKFVSRTLILVLKYS